MPFLRNQGEHRHLRSIEQTKSAGIVTQAPAHHKRSPLDLIDAGVVSWEESPVCISQAPDQRQTHQSTVTVPRENQVCTQRAPNLWLCIPMIKEDDI